MKVTVNPVCPDFQPLSMDTVTVKGVSDEPFSVKLVQHSPERKDLVLYDSAFPAAAADAQRILMYYTVSLTGTAPQNPKLKTEHRPKRSILMTKRRKALIITLIILAVIYFLLIGASYLFLKNFVDPTFADRRIVGEYPYSNAAIPEDFAEYAMHGIKLDAPDCMEAKAESSSISNYISNDPAQHDLQIIALETDAQDTLSLSEMLDNMKNEHHLVGSWLAGRGWLTELGIKKIGYELPENDNALMYLLEKMDMDDYNKFSLIEAYAFTKLYVLKAIYVPALLWVDSNDTESTLESPLSVENCSYYIEAGAFKAIVEQSSSKSGRYCLTVRCYPDTEAAKTVIVVSDDPALAQTVVASVRPA